MLGALAYSCSEVLGTVATAWLVVSVLWLGYELVMHVATVVPQDLHPIEDG